MLEEVFEFEVLEDEVAKHLQGQHDQSTHAGKKSYASIDDLVKDGLDIQESVNQIGESNASNGNVAMRVLLERTGKGGKPEVVGSIEELDGKPIYRGGSEENAQSLINADYDRVGTGQYGDGYYFSNQKGTAELFAGVAEREIPNAKGTVTAAGWKQNAKVYKMEGGTMGWVNTVAEAQSSAIDRLNINTRASDSEAAVFDMFYQDYGNAFVTDLILQGYDGMEININAL